MEYSTRIYGLVNKIINYLITPFLYIYYDIFGKRGKVSPLNSPVLEIAAVDLAEKIRTKQVRRSVTNFLELFKCVQQVLCAKKRRHDPRRTADLKLVLECIVWKGITLYSVVH